MKLGKLEVHGGRVIWHHGPVERRTRWHVTPLRISAGEMHSLGPYVYWEVRRNPERPEWGIWGRIALGVALVWWDFEVEISTAEAADGTSV